MDKPPRKRTGKKSKVDTNQLALDLPVTQDTLPLEKGEAFFLPRRRQENGWKVRGYWERLVTRGSILKQIAKDQKSGYGRAMV